MNLLLGISSQSFGPFSAAFPGHKQGVGWELEQLENEPPLLEDAYSANGGLGYYATMLARSPMISNVTFVKIFLFQRIKSILFFLKYVTKGVNQAECVHFLPGLQ